jgi:adenylate cyclase
MLIFSTTIRITISVRKVAPQTERKKSALDGDGIAALLIRAVSPMAIPQRRLSAILHADLAGSVRMAERDEDLTFSHLTSVRSEIWRPAIESAGGSLVNSTGDSMLAEFGSAVAAVAAAIDIQDRMARFNLLLDEEQRLMFRIGVHLGEVIVDEENHDIVGDGVNLAERIQGLAEPGGIAVSRALRDVTELRVDYAFVDGGEHQAKNVSRSLHVYHVRPREVTPTRTMTFVPPQATLRFHGADPSGRKFGFNLKFDRLMEKPEGLVIGRDFECDGVLSHSTVSRRHARLVLADNILHIEDLGSTNGTSVDGAVLVAGALQPLQAGNSLRIGDIELAVQYV